MKNRNSIWSLYLVIFLVLTASSCQSPENDLGLVVEDGLVATLIVQEPLVMDPVAYAFDPQGLLYVVEDRGYPDPPEGGTPDDKIGRIAQLRDTDGDGQYDERREFVTGLTYPNGVLPWDGGIFVTCAPDIYYFKDTDGDGVADIRQVVLTGFKDTKTAQLRMSHPTLGLDGWIYVTSGLNGGEIVSPLHPERDKVVFSASDGRFNPKTFEFEIVGGRSQFGITFDLYGHRFGCSNRHPVMQTVIEPQYLNRNPYLSYNQMVENVSKVAAEAVVFPLVDVATTSDFMPNLMGRSHQGTFTSASSTFIFNGSGLSPAHEGNVFICESAQNLVQRQIMSTNGVAFKSDLAYEGKEFLSSENEWFRPVYVNQGPEGGLYVVDMHRKVIDHPSYVPEAIRDKLDFQSGRDMGRIYRISSKDRVNGLKNKKWFSADPDMAELLNFLESNEEWDRLTAFNLLLQQDKLTDLQGLEKVALSSDSPSARAKALWILHVFDKLSVEVLIQALEDSEAGVREQAVLLSADQYNTDTELKQAFLARVKDDNMQVKFNVALVLGSEEGEDATKALAELALSDGQDPWMRAGILSGIGQRMMPFLTEINALDDVDSEAYPLIMEDLGQMFGNGATIAQCKEILNMVLQNQAESKAGVATVLGLAEGLSGRKELSKAKSVLSFLTSRMTKGGEKQKFESFFKSALKMASDPSLDLDTRITALELLGYTDDQRSLSILKSALMSNQLPEIQQAAIKSISKQGSAAGASLLTHSDTWSGFTPQVRSTAISALVSKKAFIPVMLDAIEDGLIAASDIPSTNRQRLMKSNNPAIKKQAEEVFSALESGDRMKIYEDYKNMFSGNGDPDNGKAKFEMICSVCHTYDGNGGRVGPDLSGIKNQPADAILLHTLVPNYEVYPTYQTVSIQTQDDRSITGWIVSETDNSVTLRIGSGDDETVLRSAIASITNTGLSLMPEGLEQTMSQQDLFDLIAYLKSGSTF
ncbi:PVC-type heme-binding CxxCH protein [Membranihabitans marinus]|uniref:PVC-type heme-binding CxxCH protein n=1 Tax=Membranihabitans marinus TaxID=1227546 RepID=UPI001F46BDD5|nr:PVC-type heme-binding CxxCH protein [Membranihabitans marinus]